MKHPVACLCKSNDCILKNGRVFRDYVKKREFQGLASNIHSCPCCTNENLADSVTERLKHDFDYVGKPACAITKHSMMLHDIICTVVDLNDVNLDTSIEYKRRLKESQAMYSKSKELNSKLVTSLKQAKNDLAYTVSESQKHRIKYRLMKKEIHDLRQSMTNMVFVDNNSDRSSISTDSTDSIEVSLKNLDNPSGYGLKYPQYMNMICPHDLCLHDPHHANGYCKNGTSYVQTYQQVKNYMVNRNMSLSNILSYAGIDRELKDILIRNFLKLQQHRLRLSHPTVPELNTVNEFISALMCCNC